MGEITKSRPAMMMASFAAIAYCLGSAFAILAYAILSPSNAGSTFTDLGHASDWLHFVGALGALAAVSIVVRDLATKQQPAVLWEVAGAAVATLLIAVGALVNASSSSSTSAANIIGAVGVGGWALLVFSRAARPPSTAPQGAVAANSEASLWLGASAGLLLLAVGSGFNVDITNQGIGVASGLIEALGVGTLTLVLATARNRRLLATRPVPTAIGGLGIVTLFFLGTAVVAGIVFGPNPSLTGLRVGIALVTTLEFIGVGVLGLAAWTRVNEIVVPAGAPGYGVLPTPPAPFAPAPPAPTPPAPGMPSPGAPPPGPEFAAPTVTPSPATCANCGAQVPYGSNVCQQCGTVLT